MPTDLFSHKQAKPAIVEDIRRLRATAIHPLAKAEGLSGRFSVTRLMPPFSSHGAQGLFRAPLS